MSTNSTPKKTVQKIKSYDIANSHDTLELAADIARFIKEQKLFTNVQGKAFVNVEGWQYAGARLGILPIIRTLERVPDDTCIKYQAKVELINLRTQGMVGCGFAICSNTEHGKKGYQEFAIASMAQTRAIGKAYRNILAWIIRAAGYEATPAEEMDWDSSPRDTKAEPVSAPAKPVSTPAPSVTTPPAATTEDRAPYSRRHNEDALTFEEDNTDPATISGKRELLLLLANKLITQEEKEKIISGINKMDKSRLQKAIDKTKEVIATRDAAAKQAEHDAIDAQLNELRSHNFFDDEIEYSVQQRINEDSSIENKRKILALTRKELQEREASYDAQTAQTK